MELLELENLIKKEKISLAPDTKMNKKAQIVDYNNTTCIFMNYLKIDTSTEEKCVLAEELGHYYYDAYYTLSSSQENIDRQEYKAKKWTIKTLVPYNKLCKLAEEGCRYSYEFAEELGVTEDLVNVAYDYYKNNNMIA